MHILIVTQKIDKNDPILGFFHGWVREFSRLWDRIVIICLEKGDYDLPANVHVYSLGKETGRSRLKYVKNFYHYTWRERGNYDAVFVHMNPEYVILGGLLWRLWGKRVGFWYNHTYGTWRARLAMKLAHFIFHTSPYAFTAGTKKSYRMPAGIDTDLFTPDSKIKKNPRAILYIGRIAPVKYVDVLVEAALKLKKRGVEFTLDIYGGYLPEHKDHYQSLQASSRQLGERVRFYGSVPNAETPNLYRSHNVFVNLTPAGNYDKTVLESLACGTLVVVSSKAFEGDIPRSFFFKEGDSAHLADILEGVFALESNDYQHFSSKLREYVEQKHSSGCLVKIVSKLYEERANQRNI